MRERLRGTRALAIVLVVVSLSCIMAGCGSSTGYIQNSTPLSPNASRARTVVVHVTSRVPDSEETTRELEGAVVERLREGEAFERVFSSLSVGARVPDLSVNATITKFEGVSNLARDSGGLLLWGPVVAAVLQAAIVAEIVADVVIQDSKTGETLGSATVRGESSKVTIQAVQRTAEQIAGFVSQR
jgi:hypothetical protein